MPDATDAWLGATALHACFSLVVTVLVYPALTATPADQWTARHASHTRAITPVVVVVYGLLGVMGAWLLLTADLGAALVVSVVATAGAAAVTALVAGPTHGRLGDDGRDEALVRRLVVADRLRTAAALAALAAAVFGACTAG